MKVDIASGVTLIMVVEILLLLIRHGGSRTDNVEVLTLNAKERKVYLKAKLNNLKRKYAKLIQHSDLLQEALEIKKEIDSIEKELNS
jgi:hypothetical protein